MATKAQCAYCFETISARLGGHRQQLSLAQIEELWDLYEDGQEDEASAQLKAESAQAAGAESDDDSDARPDATTQMRGSPYKPAAISRLLNPSPSSGSSASSTSRSAASSTPSLNSNTSGSSKSSLSSLSSKLTRGRKSQAQSRTGGEADGEEYPLFVTWNKIDHGHKRLAGCIGTFEPHELEQGLNTYSKTAAFEDDRFDHIRSRDLPILSCSITLLMHFEPISNPMDWSVGTHGLRISFAQQGRRLGATYLPDVAAEQGWSKEETIVSLLRKGGWNGRSSEWRGVKDLTVVRYQGMKASLDYGEFKEFRTWVEETGRGESGLEA